MRILVAYKTGSIQNMFVKELSDGLAREGADIVWNLEHFWSLNGDYDIVHIHWPEFLFYGNEHVNLDRLHGTLSKWKKKAKIVITRHNRYPHSGAQHNHQLYRLVYSFVDGVVHLGKYSETDFRQSDYFKKSSANRVIAHHVYNADLQLNGCKNKMASEDPYVLVFGMVRNEAERSLLMVANSFLFRKGIKMIAPGWSRFEDSRKKHPLKWMKYELNFLVEKIRSDIVIGNKYVSNDQAAHLYSNSLLVLVPRMEALNSGIVTQAFAHSKVVVGTEKGNIGELLRETGNPVFDPQQPESLENALERGMTLAKQGHGSKNFEYAQDKLTVKKIAPQYLDFFHSLLD
ncbi:MAG: glycosyltransferase [Cyclobacteriaceae bacterium]